MNKKHRRPLTVWLLHAAFLGLIAIVPQLRAADVEDFDAYKIRFDAFWFYCAAYRNLLWNWRERIL